MNPPSIRIVPKRDDARAAAPGTLPHLADDEVLLDDGDRWVRVPVHPVRVDADNTRVATDHLQSDRLIDEPRQHGGLPTRHEQRLMLACFDITADRGPCG